MSIDKEIQTWAEAKWPDATLPNKLRKLGEEFGELSEAIAFHTQFPKAEGWRCAVKWEIADCAIVLSHMARMIGEERLEDLMLEKFIVLLRRDEEEAAVEGVG